MFKIRFFTTFRMTDLGGYLLELEQGRPRSNSCAIPILTVIPNEAKQNEESVCGLLRILVLQFANHYAQLPHFDWIVMFWL